ncbi:MAG TPA: ABC transporter ATP-binding protein [Stellaceae bacterium]|nr:ABC transporter ATP-binding protein [Stellaceae bacterium]
MDPVVAERVPAPVVAAEPAPAGPLPAPVAATHRAAIELRGLTKRYGEETVVDAIAASIAPGEFFSLLGPSGSGKTTTLMMVAGFVRPDGGNILVDGRDIAAVPPQKRGFGMVFQNYAIFPHLNVFENIAFPLRARRWAKDAVAERVAWALDLVRLGRFADRAANQLSGGQQQRVALARAIVFHPPVVLMDEPLGALDKNLRFEMQVEIKEIQQRLGMTVIYVTHDQEEAMSMSDRIAIMNRGRIDQVGPPSEVYERPANPFVGRFLGEANLISGTVLAESGEVARLRLPSGHELRAPHSGSCGAGPGLLFIRPERVEIAPGATAAADPGANILLGRVRRCSFLGNILRYAVEPEAAEPVTVDLQNAAGVAPLPAGAPVVLRWPVADSLILRGEA